MSDIKNKKYLVEKGFSDGDLVSFRVENQISGGYCGPTFGILILDEDVPYIRCKHIGAESTFKMTINKGYDAYLGSIEKITDLDAEEIGVRDKMLKTGFEFIKTLEKCNFV